MLAEDMARFFDDPLGFVMYAYEWGKTPALSLVKLPEPWASRYNSEYGPDKWACQWLDDWGAEIKKNGFTGTMPVPPVRMATTSGHGIGKSCITAWACDFIMSTRPYAKGTVTANTSAQLETKTWAEVARWTKRCITGHWFDVNTGRGSMKMSHKDYKESWYCTGQTCREENSESFAGQHAPDSTSFYIFDEGSAVPDKIYEVAEGGLTDGEPMIFIFGNPTRNTGRLRECFGKHRGRWKTYRIDSRTVQLTNKEQIEEWAQDYGEDSDFFRIRVKGEFPKASSTQFIPSDIAEEGRGRVVHPHAFVDRPKVLGIDVARFGDDQTVFIKRQGVAAYGLTKYRSMNTQTIAAQAAQEIKKSEPDAIFIDMGSIGASVYDLLTEWGYDVTGVWFGSSPDDKTLYYNKRVEMWGRMRDWLKAGGAYPDDVELFDDLIGPEYGFTLKEQFQLEKKSDMKKRGIASPDCGDALALTFAYPVEISKKHRRTSSVKAQTDYKMLGGGMARTPKAKSEYDFFGQ
jgi:hypothetical protein